MASCLTTRRVRYIRFIDLHHKSIRLLTDPDLAKLDFVALSYVWGTVQNAKLSKDNEISLQVPGSLAQLILPRTISDGMSLAKHWNSSISG